MSTPGDAFIDLLLAAMADAILEKKLTQFQMTMDPDGKGVRLVRVIVVPEEMEYKAPPGSYLGAGKDD